MKANELMKQLSGKCLANHPLCFGTKLAVKISRTSMFINDNGHKTTKPQNLNSIAMKFEAPSVRVDYNAYNPLRCYHQTNYQLDLN